MNDFQKFSNIVNTAWTGMSKAEVFVADVDPEVLWATYLAAFPEGTNPLFREGADVQPFPTYVAWRDERMPEEEGEFSWHDCELCRGKAGNRYAVSAVRHEPYDYIPYSVCSDCLQYIANGDLPEDM